MHVTFKQGSAARLATELLCIPLLEKEKPRSGALRELDEACGGILAAVERSGDFGGKLWSQVLLYNPTDSGPRRLLLIGAGKAELLDLERIRQVTSRAVKRAAELRTGEIAILFPTRPGLDIERVAQAITEGAVLGDYRYDQYISGRENSARSVGAVSMIATREIDSRAVEAGIARGLVLGDCVRKVRDMVNAPANELTPTVMAEKAAATAKQFGYRAEIFERSDIRKLGMGGLLAVAQGSDQPPRFIVVEHEGADRKAKPIIVVGKGLTFDAGGICLKPAQKMDEMKGDMAGGAAALGIVEAAARLQLPARVIGLVPATENLVGASAYRPGDILRMLNGKTVFVDNTDAEGRIILGDALAYGLRFEPQAMIDLATLTGAALVALGQVATAVLGNDRTLLQKLMLAGDRCFERLWELPLWEEFEEMIKSPIADIKNSGGKNGGTITAAAFLKHFVGQTPWAHLDIAGTAYLDKAEGYRPAGGTGVGVRLLIEFLESEFGSGRVTRVRRTLAPARASRNGRSAPKSRLGSGGHRRRRARV